MGQLFEKPLDGFPKNFTIFPPSAQYCRGPGLIEDLSAPTIAIFPKCFEGAQFKIKKRFPGPLDVGYNILFSSVTPSGGQLTSSYSDKTGKLDLNLAPCGALAVQFKRNLTSIVSIELDSQVYMKRSSVARAILKYNAYNTSAAITLAGCTIPAVSVPTRMSPSIFDGQIAFGTIGVQGVYKITDNWALGSEIVLGRDFWIVASRKIDKGAFGALVDSSSGQAWWCRRLTRRFQLAGMLNVKWDPASKEEWFAFRSISKTPVATLAGYWRYPGTQIRASYTSDGLVACTLRKVLYRSEDMYFAVSLSAILNHRNDKFRLGVSFEGLT